ncbi:MAG: glycosyltransferase [Actinobacteria bacterium]|nr:glycosyltransferase [Actinomycetota bacterium]
MQLSAGCNPEAVTQHLSRVGIAADVEFDPQTPCVRVRRRLSRQPLVSVIIPTRGSSAELRGQTVPLVVNTVQTLLEKSTYQNLEFIVVADTPTPPEVRAELARLGGDRMMIVDYDQAFNFAVKNNIGVAHSSGEFVLLLNDDTEIISPDALETMLAFFADPTVGIVGPILHFEDGTIQSAGHIFSPDPTDMYRLQPADTRGAHNYVRVQREASSVIAACLLTSRKVFEEVGGLSTQFPGNWNDIDFALKVQQAGYRVIFTPHAKFFHFESKTRVACASKPKSPNSATDGATFSTMILTSTHDCSDTSTCGAQIFTPTAATKKPWANRPVGRPHTWAAPGSALGLWADRADRFEVVEVCTNHPIHVDIVEHLNLAAFGLGQQPRGEGVFVDHHVVVNVLPTIDHVGGLQPLLMQPPQVSPQQLTQVVEGEASL